MVILISCVYLKLNPDVLSSVRTESPLASVSLMNSLSKNYLYYVDSIQVYLAWEEPAGFQSVENVIFFYKKRDFSHRYGSFISCLDTWEGFKVSVCVKLESLSNRLYLV